MSLSDAACTPPVAPALHPRAATFIAQQARPDVAGQATTYPTHVPTHLHPRAAESPCGHPAACLSEVGATRCCLWCEEVAWLREQNAALTRRNAALTRRNARLLGAITRVMREGLTAEAYLEASAAQQGEAVAP